MDTTNLSNAASNEFGLNAEELKQFGIVADDATGEPAPTPEKDALSRDEVQALLDKNQRDQQHQISMLQNQLAERRSTTDLNPATAPQALNPKIPVVLDEKNQPFIDMSQTAPFFQQAFAEYHKQAVAPHEAVMADLTKQKQLTDTVDILRKHDPTLLEGRDPKEMAGLALGLYNSPTNPGSNETDKANYVFQQLQQMKLAPGNPSIRSTQPSNQVGRTESGGNESRLPFKKNQTVTVFRTTASEMGLDAFNESIAQERYLHEQSAAQGLNLNIQVKRPPHLQ